MITRKELKKTGATVEITSKNAKVTVYKNDTKGSGGKGGKGGTFPAGDDHVPGEAVMCVPGPTEDRRCIYTSKNKNSIKKYLAIVADPIQSQNNAIRIRSGKIHKVREHGKLKIKTKR